MAGYAPIEIPLVRESDISDGGATATVVLTSSAISTPGPNATIILSGVLYVSAGTAATHVVISVYRGPYPGGHLVLGSVGQDVTPGGNDEIPFMVSDQPGDVSDLTYSVVVTEVSATAPGYIYNVAVGGFIS